VTFAAAAEESRVFYEIHGADPALDSAVLAKVLPKFPAARSKLETSLKVLLAWCRDPSLCRRGSVGFGMLQIWPTEAQLSQQVFHVVARCIVRLVSN
jgi:hypothetical protein